MIYKIEQVEGIGTKAGQQLMSVGIHTTEDMLKRCGTTDKLRQLELDTGIPSELLSTWMRQSDLMRVSGIGPEFGQLLEESGIESVAQLAERDANNIAHLVARVNEAKGLTRALPAASTVTRWIEQAKEMTDGMTEPTEMSGRATTTAPAAMAPPEAKAAPAAMTSSAKKPTPYSHKPDDIVKDNYTVSSANDSQRPQLAGR